MAEQLAHFLRMKELRQKTGLGKTVIYEKIKLGEFKPYQLAPRAVGFLSTDVDAWIASRPVARSK